MRLPWAYSSINLHLYCASDPVLSIGDTKINKTHLKHSQYGWEDIR